MASIVAQLGAPVCRERIKDGTALSARHSGTVELWASSSRISCARLRRTRRLLAAAYRGDVEAFVAWVSRAGVSDPEKVDRLMLRRYLAYLATRRYSRRTIARKAAAVRRYFAWLRRHELVGVDPSRRLSAPAGEARLPRVLTPSELRTLLEPVADGARADLPACRSTPETMRCSSFSTAAGCGWPSSAGLGSATSI